MTTKYDIVNPVTELKELCDFIKIVAIKKFKELSGRYQCIITFGDKTISSEWKQNQREAEKNASYILLSCIPIRKIEDNHVTPRGNGNEATFQAMVEIDLSTGEKKTFYSPWLPRKVDAKKDLMLKIINHFLIDIDGSSVVAKLSLADLTASHNIPLCTPSSVHVTSANETQTKRVENYIRKWQSDYLDIIKKSLNIPIKFLGNPEHLFDLNRFLTLAFIHPSFAHTLEIKETVKNVLNTKWSDYERLEFFGDAILNLIASDHLFYENDADTPHILTVKRQSMVREDACSGYLRKMGLEQFMIHKDILQTPSAKMLCDIFESIIGGKLMILLFIYFSLYTNIHFFYTQLSIWFIKKNVSELLNSLLFENLIKSFFKKH